MRVNLAAIGVAILASVSMAAADGPKVSIPVPADFKLRIASYGVSKDPVYTEEVVIRSGRIYVFPSDSNEVIIISPKSEVIDLVDIVRKVQCEVSFQTLDESLIKLKASLLDSAQKLEKEGGKAKLIEAKMARNLFETKLDQTFDAKTNQVRLKNPSVEVEAVGEPEADPARLAYVKLALTNIARLGTFRAPEDLPPFIELETIGSLMGDRRFRPTSITTIYRLAGPPRKMKRTYNLVPTLTDREIEAIRRVDRLCEVAPSLRYDQFRVDR